MLRAHLHDALVLAHGSDHASTLNDIVTVRLFDVDVLACLATEYCGDGVPMIGSADAEDVYARVVDYRSKVLHRPGLFSLHLFHQACHGSESAEINVCDGGDFHLRMRSEDAVKPCGPTPCSDHARSDSFVGRAFLG